MLSNHACPHSIATSSKQPDFHGLLPGADCRPCDDDGHALLRSGPNLWGRSSSRSNCIWAVACFQRPCSWGTGLTGCLPHIQSLSILSVSGSSSALLLLSRSALRLLLLDLLRLRLLPTRPPPRRCSPLAFPAPPAPRPFSFGGGRTNA